MSLQLPKPLPIWPVARQGAILAQVDTDTRERAYRDHRFFIETFFPDYFWGEMSPMHQDFCEIEQEPERQGVLEVTAAPRGHAKTVFRALVKPIHAIVYGYRHFIAIIGWSGPESDDKTGEIRDQLLQNEALIRVYGKRVSGTAGKTDFVTLDQNTRVLSRSTGGQIRGLRHKQWRPDMIVCDDILSLERVQTPEQREKTRQWFFKDVMGAKETKKAQAGRSVTNVHVINTVLHPEDLVTELLNKPGWRRKRYQALISWAKRKDLWDEWKRLYTNLDNPDNVEDSLAFYEANKDDMLDGAQVLWPEGDSYYDLMVYIIDNGLASFYSEKQNDPQDPESQILFPDKCAKFKVYRPGDPEWLDELGPSGFAIVRNDNGKAIHSQDLRVVAFLDPALGKTPKKATSDYAALVVCAQDAAGYIYVLDVWLHKKPPNEQVAQCYAKHIQWGFDLYLETVGFQELLKGVFKEYEALYDNQIRVIGVHQYHNKQARISTLEPYLENKWVLFAEGLDEEFMNQLRLFPTVHDDGPDALQGCVAKLRKPMGGITTIDREQVA